MGSKLFYPQKTISNYLTQDRTRTSSIISLMKIDFYIDYEEDLRYVLARLTRLDPAGLENRLKDKEIDVGVAKDILNTSSEQEKLAILDKLLKEYYEKNLTAFEETQSEYQKIWEDRTDNFFSVVTEIMDSRNWKYNEYLFLVSSFFSRAQWGKGNKLAVWWKREPKKFWFLNGYELILSHVFEIVDQIYKERPISDWHIWALAESIAYILVYREEKVVKTLWPMLKEPDKFSYPQLIKHIDHLNQVYKKSSVFDDFLKESVEYIKNYTEGEITKPV